MALAVIHLTCFVLIGGLILIRKNPEDKGQTPDGISSALAKEITEKSSYTPKIYENAGDLQTGQVLRKPTIWLIVQPCMLLTY